MKLSMKLFLLLLTASTSKVSNEVSMCSFYTYCMQGRVIPEDVLPSLTTQLETNSRSENVPVITVDPGIEGKRQAFHTSFPYLQSSIQGKAKPQDVSPISMTQLEAKSDPQSPPAARENLRNTVHTAPTDAVPPPVHSLNPATRLKHKLRDTKDLIVCPGVYDGLSARIAQSVGFETLYMVRQRHVYCLCNTSVG